MTDYSDLLMQSIGSILEEGPTAGHDITHTLRVRELCLYIAGIEGGDCEILEASALLHDIGRVEEFKNPNTDHAVISARMAPDILRSAGFPAQKIGSVVYSIANHRYSSGVIPVNLEAKILQDADRLDISGALGIAMTFAYSGAHGHALYHINDPLCKMREPDDHEYALDHILSKLIHLPGSMHTDTARRMAQERNSYLTGFIDRFIYEITFSRSTQ